MTSTKRVKKKRLKEDQLVTFTVKASQFIQQYFTQVIAGVVVLVVVVGAVFVTSYVRKNAARESEKELALAMSQFNMRDLENAAGSFTRIADKYGSQSAGEVSRYFLGKTLLAQGKPEEALQAFEQYIAKGGAKAPFADAAVIGKASCMEALHNYLGAADVLERLSQSLDPDDPRYLEVMYEAGRNYERAGSKDKALELYGAVAAKATGPLKDRVTVSLSLLQ
jgi:tetratricopeptide (TPR) repeat protein